MMSSPWTTIVLASLIALLQLLRGRFSESLWIALLGLVLLGAIFPPAGIITGGLALFYVAFVHGPQLANQVTTTLGGSSQ